MSTLTEIRHVTAALSPEDLTQLEMFVRELCANTKRDSELTEIVRQNGVHPLPRRSNAVVTSEMVRQLCEQEGV